MRYKFKIIILTILIFTGCKKTIEAAKDDGTQANSIRLNPQLASEINSMYDRDQYISGMPQGKYEGDWQGWFKYRDTISKHHKVKLNEILNQFGYPGYNLVGEDASHNYWNMAQHCDFDVPFQQKVLAALKKEVKNDNARSSYIGFLTDRINMNLEKPQVYGTQLDYNMSKGKAFPRGGLIDSANVDKRRRLLKMKPYATYLNDMLEFHFEMNKEHYAKIGIKSPEYY